jgi:hypothetical protein
MGRQELGDFIQAFAISMVFAWKVYDAGDFLKQVFVIHLYLLFG